MEAKNEANSMICTSESVMDDAVYHKKTTTRIKEKLDRLSRHSCLKVWQRDEAGDQDEVLKQEQQ